MLIVSTWGSEGEVKLKLLCFSRLCYNPLTEVRSFLEHSCMILNSFKIVIIFNITSTDFVLISADVSFKMITVLKEMRIAQLCSKNEWTLQEIPTSI